MAGVFIAYTQRALIAADRYRRRRKLPGADEILSGDDRPPILYLRSFDVDNPGGILGAGGPLTISKFMAKPVEELVTDDLSSLGPVIAVGKPGERLKPLGAARLYYADEEWQEQVEELIAISTAIVFLCDMPSAGFEWEIQRIVELADPTTVLGVVMGDKHGMSSYGVWADVVERHLPDGLPPFDTLPERESSDDTTPRAWLTFDEDWRPTFNAIEDWALEPAPSSLLVGARWSDLATLGSRFVAARSGGDAASKASADGELIRSLLQSEAAQLRLARTVDPDFNHGDAFVDATRVLEHARASAEPGETRSHLTRSHEQFTQAHAAASSPFELAGIELCLGIVDILLERHDDAAQWLRTAFDRATTLISEVSHHARKVESVGEDDGLLRVAETAEWVANYFKTRKHRQMDHVAAYLDGLVPLVNCLSTLRNALDNDPPLPGLDLEKTYSLLRTNWVSLVVTIREHGTLEQATRPHPGEQPDSDSADALQRAEAALGPGVDRWSAHLHGFLAAYAARPFLNLYVAPDIPEKRLRNAARLSELPEEEVPIALFDTNALSSGKGSLIFGRKRLYFNNAAGLTPRAYVVTYQWLARNEPQPTPYDHSVRFGRNREFYNGQAGAVHMFRELAVFAKDHYG